MVVDDEAALVSLMEDELAELGYDPRGFSDPLLALQAFEAAPGDYELVVTDQAMPGLTGTELARRLLHLRPGLPLLIVSGFGGPDFEHRAAELGAVPVLVKPVERAELARAVDRAMRHLSPVLPPDSPARAGR
jgi:FixJ family two-component response regulator